MPVATCHCGDTRIEFATMPTDAMQCTCTFCSKSGGLWAYFEPGELVISAPHDAVYSASGGLNRHHFCARCGCQTYGVSPAWTEASITSGEIPKEERLSLNIRLIDGVDTGAIRINSIDGRNLW